MAALTTIPSRGPLSSPAVEICCCPAFSMPPSSAISPRPTQSSATKGSCTVIPITGFALISRCNRNRGPLRAVAAASRCQSNLRAAASFSAAADRGQHRQVARRAPATGCHQIARMRCRALNPPGAILDVGPSGRVGRHSSPPTPPPDPEAYEATNSRTPGAYPAWGSFLWRPSLYSAHQQDCGRSWLAAGVRLSMSGLPPKAATAGFCHRGS
jgi:hypothetical protein